MERQFCQVDVFADELYLGNPVAVVLDAKGLDTAEMQRFASWTNLSETTFVLPPQAAGADYRVRIFTPSRELPFAGHPTLGTCHAWLSGGGTPQRADVVVQECDAGLIELRRIGGALAFAGPPLLRSGPVDDETLRRIVSVLGIGRADIVDAQWVDNGPGWVGVLLNSADAVLALRPGPADLDIGVAGPYPAGSSEAFEVRAFTPALGGVGEDPVTGSLNASLAGWLLAAGHAAAPYVASQGAALGRRGRVHITRDPDGTIWVGGGTKTGVTGRADL
ncbi:MAG: PhzF family phenazine biosynthesis protein [Streptosporangiaceae bacterium]|jgi:PhzF family phenazine biosynthesis protein